MKKLFAALTALCLLCCSVAVLAEAAPAATTPNAFYLYNGVSFGMTPEQVIGAHGSQRYERDVEHTIPGLNFDELEYEKVNVLGGTADLHYYFMDGKLIGAKAEYDDNPAIFEQLKAKLDADFGEGVAPDLSVLGKGIYAVDDDGRLEGKSIAWISGDMIIVMEQDEDDVKVSCLDLSAEYVK